MTKPWLLIVLGIILASLLGLWLYLFLGGDDAREDLFATFGLGEVVDDFFIDDTQDGSGESGALATLRQLTLRPVVGYHEVGTSTNRSVLIAEAGTGHIYQLDTQTGAEERISNNTIAMASDAVFSPDGNAVAISSHETGKGLVLISNLGTASSSVTTIPISPVSVSFLENGSFVYALHNNQETVGYVYGETPTELFRIPFREVNILWGGTSDSPHLMYPKTSATLEGYLYAVTDGVLSRLPLSGFGFSARSNIDTSSILYLKKQKDVFDSIVYQRDGATKRSLGFTALPEKCAFATHTTAIVCAVANTNESYSADFPDSWYEGRDTFTDSLWFISTDTTESKKVLDLSVSGRNIDAMDLAVSPDGQASYFINRYDNSLWIFDRDFTAQVPDNQ